MNWKHETEYYRTTGRKLKDPLKPIRGAVVTYVHCGKCDKVINSRSPFCKSCYDILEDRNNLSFRLVINIKP